jgi:hypothetical protein
MASPFLVFTKGFLDARCVMHEPALNGAVVYGITAFLHQFFQIAIAQGLSHVPANAL